MKYTPSPIPTNFPADVRAWLGDELRRISAALNGVDNVRLKTQGAEPSKYADGDIVYADGTSWNPGDGEGMYVREAGAWVKTGAGAGGGATELSGLSDVNTSTPTNRNALMADGVDWESRALVEADISDLGSYTESAANETITGSWTFKGTLEVEHSASTDYGRFYHTGSDFIIEASPPPTTNYFKMTNSRFGLQIVPTASTGGLRIWNTAISKLGVMYNDGTDFVIGASSGEIQFTKPLKTYNASLAFRGDGGTTGAIGAIDFYPNATIGAWARGLTYRKQSNSQILGGFGGFGTNESLTYMPFGIGSSFFTSPTLAVYADYALIAQGNSLRIEDATEADYLDISHDGIDLNFEFVNTTDVNFNNASGYKIDGNDIATSDGTTGGTASAGSGNQYVELVIGATTYKVLHDGTI